MYGFDTLRAPHLRIVGFDISVPESLLSNDWTAKYAIFVRSSGVEIRDNYIHDVPGAGIHAYWTHPWPSDVVIRDNYLTRINQGIVAHGYNWLIENNEVTRLVVYNMDCDYMRFFGRNITIRGNLLHGARLSDIGNSHVDGFQTFPNNGWFAEDILIESNFVESFHQGAMLGVADYDNHSGYIRNLTFTNNVFIAGEIGGSWGILNAHVENTEIRHNLFLNMQYHGVGIRFGGSGTVQNNIFINCGHQNYYVESGSSMVGGYNLLDHMPSTPLYTNPNDIVANPRLINPSNPLGPDGRPFTTDDGYRLGSDSPAIDAAYGAFTSRDIFGNTRPYGGAADIGPHELGASGGDGGNDGDDGSGDNGEPMTYYVDGQDSAASDSNPGTADQPWRTLAKASASVKPGDTVVVRPGVYDERVTFAGGNLASATVPTVFKADPPREALTRGFDTAQAPHLQIVGFEISAPATVVSSNATARYAVYVRSDGVEVINNHIRDSVGVGVQGTWASPWPKDVVVRDNTIERVSQGISIYGENWLVEDNEIRQLVYTDMDCDYVRFFGRNITIRRNYLHGSTETHLGTVPIDAFQTFPNNGWYAEDVTIDSNVCQSFNRGAMLGSGDYASQTGFVRNLTFTNNVFAGGAIASAWGIQGIGTENLVVRNNLFLNLGSAATGVGVRTGSSAIVQNNIFQDAGENYWADEDATMTGGYNLMNQAPPVPIYENPQDMVADPQLVDAAGLTGPDGAVLTDDDGYLLTASSPAIDRAGGTIIAADVLGTARPQGTAGDIGPHEFVGGGDGGDDGGGDDPTDPTPTTYYVSSGSSASDSNPGTEAAPWRTLAKASAAVKPGDTVVVGPGVYDERVTFANGNLEGATEPTTFIADPPREARTLGFDTLLAPHLKVIGFEVSVPASAVSSDATARYAMYVRSDGVQLVDNYIHDCAGVAIHAAWVEPWPKDVVIRDNTIERVSQGIAIYGENWLVQDNEIRQLVYTDMDCDYVRFFGRNIVIRRNYLHGSTAADLGTVPIDAFQTFPANGWYAEDVTIDSNVCQSFNRGAMLGSGDYATQTGYIRNVTLTNNVFAGGDIPGAFGINCVGVENLAARNNLFLNLAPDGSGVAVNAGSSAEVQNNIFQDAGENYWAADGASLIGGYNILNRVPDAPRYSNGADLIADPLLTNPWDLEGPDGQILTTDDGYLLQAASPAIDRAGGLLIATDILGRSRPYGSGTDIGPHESRDVDKKAWNRRKKFKDRDSSPKDGRLSQTEAEMSTMEFAAVDTSSDGYLTMDELIEASLGLPANKQAVVWVIFGYTGPETGSEAAPFATLAEGMAFVRPGGELRLRGRASGSFVGPWALKKGVRMVSASGVAQIGGADTSTTEAYRMTSNTSDRSFTASGTATGGESGAASEASDGAGAAGTSATGGGTTDSGTLTSGDSGDGAGDAPSGTAFVEPVLPAALLSEGTRVLTGAQPVAVRVVSEQPIDPASLWAEIPEYLRPFVTVDWVSHDPERKDVWVRVTPKADWASLLAPGDAGVLTVAAGAGEARTESYALAVVPDAGTLDILQPLPDLENGIGLAYEIMPEEAYDAPVAVEIVFEPGLAADDVELMYYDHARARWIPARQVVGFIADSTLDEDTLVVTFNHAGTVQLRLRK